MNPQAQTQQPRIVFLDYLRIFACFLVMLVHASENFYGAAGSTDMAGPQSFLANETDRLWVSLYDGFSRMSVPLFIIVSAYLLMPMPAAQTSWQFYRRRAKRILPPFFVFMILYSTLPLLWGQIDTATSTRDLSRLLLNFPTLAGHLWFMYPLISIYLFIPIISPWLERATAREERFFILLFLISTCIPYLHRWCGEVCGIPRILRHSPLHTQTPYMEPPSPLRHGPRTNGGRRRGYDSLVLRAGRAGRNTLNARHRDRLVDVHDQLRRPHNRHLPALHLHTQHLGTGIHNPYVETQLRCLPDAHILARILGRHIQGCACPAHRRRHPGHSRSNIHKLLRDGSDHSIYPRQQVGYRRLIVRGVPQKVDNENFYVVITAFFRKFVKWRRSA